MKEFWKVAPAQMFMGHLDRDTDLLSELTQVCIDQQIQFGRIEALGAVKKAHLAFYNQQTRTYDHLHLDEAFEIVNLTGNVAPKDGQRRVHIHITLADKNGQVFGGHLLEGTVVYACEWIIEKYTEQNQGTAE